MKLAIIPPIAYLGDFSTDCHLVLAQLYKQSALYRAFYKLAKVGGEFIILDNGAAEKGASIDSEELFELALDLKPSVLVCPDVLRDADKTLTATNHFLDDYAKRLYTARIQLMAVPQGKTDAEWYHAFEWFNNDPALSWLGISKYVVGAFPDRLHALAMIELSVRKKVHLLGMAGVPEDVIAEKRFRFVQSTDTAVPVKLGMQGLRLIQYEARKPIGDEEYFGMERTIDKVDYRYGWAKKNIEDYKEYCK